MNNRTVAYDFTIIVPFYNEEECLPELGRRLGAYMAHSSRKACALLVNDGSTDGSEIIAEGLCRENPDVFLLSLERNSGLSAALKAGFDNCFSPLAGYIDADLQTDPEDFEQLLSHIDKGYSLVQGRRVKRNDPVLKRLSSKIANAWRRHFTRDGFSDTCCPLKVIDSATARRLPMFKGMHRFMPALVQMDGGRCLEVPVRHYPRLAGKAKYGLLNRLAGPFADCFAVRWMMRRHISATIKSSNLV